jgi:hypothetical protein
MSPNMRPRGVSKPEERKEEERKEEQVPKPDYTEGDEDLDDCDIDEIVDNHHPYCLEKAKSVLNFPPQLV